jgi:hypothetical protein
MRVQVGATTGEGSKARTRGRRERSSSGVLTMGWKWERREEELASSYDKTRRQQASKQSKATKQTGHKTHNVIAAVG